MKEMLHALMGKMKPSKMDPADKHAKMSVLKDIHKMASHDMGEGMKKGMGKVEVHSDSPAGLESGLDRAHDLIEQSRDEGTDKDFADSDMAHPEDDTDDFEDHQEENKALQGHGMGEHEKPDAGKLLEGQIDHESAEGDLSDEEIDEMIKHLNSKKKMK